MDRTRSKGDEKQVGADSKKDQKLPPKKRPHVPPGNSEEKNDEESLENREDLSIPKTDKKKDEDLSPLLSRRDEGKRYQLRQTENRTTMDTIEGKITKRKQDKKLPRPGTQEEGTLGGPPKEQAELPLFSKRRKKDDLDIFIQQGLTTNRFVPILGKLYKNCLLNNTQL